MKIAVYSDIHDNLHNLKEALTMIKELEVEEAICLGDFINPGIVNEIINSGIKTHCIWGNNDGEKVGITKMILDSNNVTIADSDFDVIGREGKKAALIHRPDLAPSLAKSGEYDAVFYGHNHEKYFEKVGDCMLCNPGEVSGHKTGEVTFVIWDTETNEVEFKEVQDKLLVSD